MCVCVCVCTDSWRCLYLCFCRRTRRQDIRNGDPLTQCSDLQHHGRLKCIFKKKFKCNFLSAMCKSVNTSLLWLITCHFRNVQIKLSTRSKIVNFQKRTTQRAVVFWEPISSLSLKKKAPKAASASASAAGLSWNTLERRVESAWLCVFVFYVFSGGVKIRAGPCEACN